MDTTAPVVSQRKAARRFNLGLLAVAIALIAFCLMTFLVLNLMDRSNERARAREALRSIAVDQVVECDRLGIPLTRGEPKRNPGETEAAYRVRLEAWAETIY